MSTYGHVVVVVRHIDRCLTALPFGLRKIGWLRLDDVINIEQYKGMPDETGDGDLYTVQKGDWVRDISG